MMYLKQYSFCFGFITLFLMGCGGNDAAPSDAELQSTVGAAVQATTDALNAATSAPIVASSVSATATPPPADSSDVEAAAIQSEDSEPPTPTPLPTITNTPTPAATPTPEAAFIKTEQGDGSFEYQLPYEGFSLTLPSDWLVANLTESSDPTEQSEIEQVLGSDLFQGLVDSGLKLYALNWSEASRASGNPANLNIATLGANGASTVNEFAQATVDRLTYEFDLEEGEISQTEAAVNGLPAIRLDYFSETQTPTGIGLNLQGVQYLVLVNDTIYTVVITLPAELGPTLLPDIESAVQNMNFYIK